MSVTCDRSVVFSWYSGFLHQLNWLPRYSWNIVQSGVKHHKPKPKQKQYFSSYFPFFLNLSCHWKNLLWKISSIVFWIKNISSHNGGRSPQNPDYLFNILSTLVHREISAFKIRYIIFITLQSCDYEYE